jgi:LmbE family N-acetylglucosaminyl deacetylase
MRWIIISPHFDDAVLSCGGLLWEISRGGAAVEIWTVCAGIPPEGPLSELAGRIHAQWGTGEARQTVELRRAEDREAAAVMGATARHFSTLDCIYRMDAGGVFLYNDDVFDAPHSADAGLPDRIAAELGAHLTRDDRVVAPLAVGHHVDHVITRRAAERLGTSLSYYAEIPYLLRFPEELPAASAGLTADLRPVSPAGLRAWQKGVGAYASQMSMLFDTEREMRRQVRGYWERERGTRLWSRGPSPKAPG